MRRPALSWERAVPLLYMLLAVGVAGTATFEPASVGLGLAALIAGGVLVLRHPAWGVYALILSVPLQREITIAGKFTATQAVTAGLLLAWVCWIAVGRRKLFVPPFAVALAAYLTVMLASLIVATSLSDGAAEVSRWLVVLLAYVIIVNTIETRAQVIGMVFCFCVGLAAEAALGLQQVITRQVPPSFFVGQGGGPEDMSPRAFGTIGAPNSYAGYLNMTLAVAIALAVYLLIHLERRRPKPPAGFPVVLALGAVGLAGIGAAAMVFSYSRGGLIGLGFGLLAMVVALGRRAAPALAGLAVGAALIGALAVGGALPASVTQRVSDTLSQLQIFDVRGIEPTPETFNQLERLAHWQAAWGMYLSDPWLGIGIGNFNFRYTDFAVAEWPVSRGHAHNYFLQALSETGLFGLAAYLALVGAAVVGGWRAIRRAMREGPGIDAALLVGAFGVVFSVIGHSVFENLHVLNMGIQWAAVIALFWIVPRLAGAAETAAVRGTGAAG
ncbi:MAG: O-antigen ligase family protein [Chloroflexia bacterium]